MAERTGGLFRQLPLGFVRPERGNFFTVEPGANAHRGVMTRHVVATNCPEQAAAKQRPAGAARFKSNEYSNALGNQAEQFRQSRGFKMMQEQIGDDGAARIGTLRPVENVGDNGFRRPTEFYKTVERSGGDIRLQIKQRHIHARPVSGDFLSDSEQKIPIARAQFGNLTGGEPVQIILQCLCHDGVVGHPGIDTPQVTARVNGARITGRQRVEHFGLDDAFHFIAARGDARPASQNYPTFNSAP